MCNPKSSSITDKNELGFYWLQVAGIQLELA